MSSSEQKNAAKKDYYLLEDRFLGFIVYYCHQGGRFLLKLLALVYAIPAVYIMWRFYLTGQFWSGWLTLLLLSIPSPIVITAIHLGYVWGEKRVASAAVLLHVLRDIDERCSNGSMINWRQIAHSANKYSEELGESPMVFYSGRQCMNYVFSRAVHIVNGGWSVFHDKSREAAKLHNDIATSAVKKYKERRRSFYKETDTLLMRRSPSMRGQKECLGT